MSCSPSYSNLLLSLTDSNRHVLGEQELPRNEVLAELSKAADAGSGPRFLHIMIKQADIERLYLIHAPCILQGLGEGSCSGTKLSKAADAKGGPKFLHIVVKLADIESVWLPFS
jgi:hypothetical protein